jgi:hypothetical protein
MLKKIGAACLAVAAVLTIGACSTRPPADMIALYYKAGAGDNKKFEECIEPGTDGKYPVDDEVFYLPTSLRTWSVLPEGGDNNVFFTVASAPDPKTNQPGPQMGIWVTVEFYLNTNCEGGATSPIVQFWEKTGRRPWKDGKGISTSGEDGFNEDAWKVMLQNILVPVEIGVLNSAARKHSADDLDSDKDGLWAKMEAEIGPAFNAQLKTKVGGDYFCGSTYNRNLKDCPAVTVDIVEINFADGGIQAARNNVFKAKQEREAELTRAQTELDKANLLAKANRNPQYLEFAKLEADLERARLELEAAKACAANPNCTVIVGVGQNVGVHAGK